MGEICCRPNHPHAPKAGHLETEAKQIQQPAQKVPEPWLDREPWLDPEPWLDAGMLSPSTVSFEVPEIRGVVTNV